ncbi:hypothetical protein Cni_G16292 [Canna indica]|uniref:Senescence regulator n=1 Tax=Canna indica TaxID=4628 RepID=A0AAQ3KEX4_9LILI|nr:hypothetical protein Cni_G16292 [Canna indica]
MGEDAFATVATPTPSAIQMPAASSLRLLGLLKQPDPDPDALPPHQLELDESEVVWSSVSSDGFFSSQSPSSSPSHSSVVGDELGCTSRFSSPSPDVIRSPLEVSSCSSSDHVRRPFTPERFGLSAALAEDLLPLLRQRRPVAASARATRPVAVPAGVGEEAVLVGRVGYHQSAPVNVPAWPRWRKGQKADALRGLEEEDGWEKTKEVEEEEEEEEEAEEEMVPPHVIVARSHVTKFSVFEGVGRTLKGRDLRRVRNAVLKKTGFLDI